MFKESYYLFVRKMKATVRQPVWIVVSLSTPLLLIALYAPLLRGMGGDNQTIGEVLNMFVPGLLTLIAFSAGISAGWEVILDLRDGVIERFRVTSARRFSILMGTVFHDIVMFLVPATFLLIIALPFGFRIDVGGLLVLLVLLCLLTAVLSAWSCAMALIIKEMGGLSALLSGIQMPLMLLAGILLPLSHGPRWLEILGHFNPLFYTVEAARDLATGDIFTNSVGLAFAIFLPLVILTMWWSTRVHKKAIK